MSAILWCAHLMVLGAQVTVVDPMDQHAHQQPLVGCAVLNLRRKTAHQEFHHHQLRRLRPRHPRHLQDHPALQHHPALRGLAMLGMVLRALALQGCVQAINVVWMEALALQPTMISQVVNYQRRRIVLAAL